MGATPNLILNLGELFQKQFGSKPYLIGNTDTVDKTSGYAFNGMKSLPSITNSGSLLREKYLGIDIFLPIRFFDETGTNELMYLPYSVLRISGKNSVVSTPMIDRKGAVHELTSSDDYSIDIKGFLIGSDRSFPEDELYKLKALKDRSTALVIDNAITNIFLTDPELSRDEQRRVVFMDFDLPEVQGGREHVRPFSIKLLSDTVFDLEL